MVRKTRKGSAAGVKSDSSPNKEEAQITTESSSWKRWLMDFEMEVDERLHKLDMKLTHEIDTLDRLLMVTLNKIPPHEAKLPPQSLSDLSDSVDSTFERSLLSTIKKGQVITSTVCKPTASSPPGTSRVSRSRTHRRSLSACNNFEDARFTRPVTRSSSQSRIEIPRTVTKYQTPATKSNRTLQMVTPKVDPYCPMPLKRFARQGEMAISLEGSPLMVTTNISEPNICLPVNNGEKVYSIMASEGSYQLPLLDDTTREKLRILRQNLDLILGDQSQK